MTKLPVAVIDEESASKPGEQFTILARFATIKEAEEWIGSQPDKDKVARGGYGIDAPEAMVNPAPRLWFSSSSGRIELSMTLEQAQSASHQGQCDDDVLSLSHIPMIAVQLAALDSKLLASELKEYGAWDETQLADHDQNLQRILWLAAGDIDDKAVQSGK